MSTSPSEIFRDAIAESRHVTESLVGLETAVAKAADLIISCLTTGHKMLVCGNGGSAADAADFSTEFACRFAQDRRPYPALNLAAGGSLLTATGNDYGFEEIFARQVKAFGQADDVLVVISTSGNSANIQRALEAGKGMKLHAIALLGRNGGKSAGIADVDLTVKAKATARIQEAHKFLLHVLCEICEPRLAAQ